MGADRYLEDSWNAQWGIQRPEDRGYIWVRNGRSDDRVAIWERHAKHPGGELMVAGPSRGPVQVWTTDLVLQALWQGDLVRVPGLRDEQREREQSARSSRSLSEADAAAFKKQVEEVGRIWREQGISPGGQYVDVRVDQESNPVRIPISRDDGARPTTAESPDEPAEPKSDKEQPPWAKRKSRRIS